MTCSEGKSFLKETCKLPLLPRYFTFLDVWLLYQTYGKYADQDWFNYFYLISDSESIKAWPCALKVRQLKVQCVSFREGLFKFPSAIFFVYLVIFRKLIQLPRWPNICEVTVMWPFQWQSDALFPRKDSKWPLTYDKTLPMTNL